MGAKAEVQSSEGPPAAFLAAAPQAGGSQLKAAQQLQLWQLLHRSKRPPKPQLSLCSRWSVSRHCSSKQQLSAAKQTQQHISECAVLTRRLQQEQGCKADQSNQQGASAAAAALRII